MPFRQRIRLPLELTKPQWPQQRTAQRLANGKVVTQSVVVQKVYIGGTDWMPEKWHEKVVIALSHDYVSIEGEKYIGIIAQTDQYDVAWQDKSHYATAPASFKAEVVPFSASNSNCQTCEEAIQVVAVDDNAGTHAEGSTTNYNVSTNDSYCCYPITFSIRYYDPSVVASATIDTDGTAHITLKTPIQSYTNLKVASYRAECSSGQYDDADIYMNITGSVLSCLAPTGLGVFFISNSSAVFNWTAGVMYFSGTYHYTLFADSNLGAPVHEGDTSSPSISFSDLTPGTNYTFYVHATCAPGVTSNDVSVGFKTTGEGTGMGGTNICGQYIVVYNDPENLRPTAYVHYVDCMGDAQNEVLINGVSKYICALESAPGTPISIGISVPPGQQNITYYGSC